MPPPATVIPEFPPKLMTADVIEPASPTAATARGARLHRRGFTFGRLARAAAVLILAASLIGTYAWHHWPPRRWAAALSMIDYGVEEPLYYVSLGFRSMAFEPEAAIMNAHFDLRSGRPTQAIRELEVARDSERTRWRALVLSGAAWSNLGRLKDATASWEAALAEGGEQVDLHRGLAASYYDLGAMGPAQHHLERWIELSPRDPRPHRLMATIYKDFSRLPQAAEHFQIVLRLLEADPRLAEFVPNPEQVSFDLATCLADLGKYDEALEVLAKSGPTAEVLAVRAECHYAEGKIDEAQKEVRAALELAPSFLPALLLRADLALEQERLDEAYDFAHRAVAAYPTESSARQRLGLVYQRLGRLVDAEAELRKMESLKELRLRFTELHERAAQNPYDVDVRCELGRVARELGMDDLALEWFGAALRIDANDKRARQALEELNPRQNLLKGQR